MNELRLVEQNLLSKLSVIEYKYRIMESNEEQFNIFTALLKENDEVRLHSRFLSIILSPTSSHKKSDFFLKQFLNTLTITNFETDGVEVFPTEKDKSEYKEIDILIINRKQKQAIIIENKIGAGDSNHENRGQLEGYYNQIKNIDKIPAENIYVFYLTMDRHEPSSESLGQYQILENINGSTIDYEHEIADWLNLCLKECTNQPYLRECIFQYLNLIKQMTNNTSDLQARLDIRDLIASSSDNMKGAKLLMENFKHVKWHTAMDFWNELQEELKIAGYDVFICPTISDITNTTHYDTYKKDYISKNDYGLKFNIEDGLSIWIWNGSDENWLFWGISDSEVSDMFREKINKFCNDYPHYFENNIDENFKWKYFDLSDDENIFFPDFSYAGTFNLIEKNYRINMIHEKLVPEIKNFIKRLL